MDTTAASPNDLERYVDGGRNARTDLETQARAVTRMEMDVRAACADYHPSAGATDSLAQLTGNMESNEIFVHTVHDALVAADVGHTGSVVTVADSAIDARLNAAGVAQPPPPVVVEPVTLYGLPPWSGLADDPVCTANGNLYHADEDLPGYGFAAALTVQRSYNSLDRDSVGAFGRGWTALLDVSVTPAEAGHVRVRLGDGATIPFVETDGAYRPTARPHLDLARTDAGWTLRDGRDRWHFDDDGVLVAATLGAAALRFERGRAAVRVVDDTSTRWVRYELADSRVRSVVASDGRRVDYEYDEAGDLQQAARPFDTMRYEFADGLLVAMTDADGVELFRNTFDASGRVTTQISPHGRVTHYDYQPNGLTLVTDDDGGPRNLYVHDQRGNLTSLVDGSGATMRIAYDSSGRPIAVTDRTGATRRIEYDEHGNVVARIDPDGGRVEMTWDDQRRLTSERGAAGALTRYEYSDDHATPAVVIAPDGGRTTAELDARGLPVLVTDPDGVSHRFEWDRAGLVTATIDALDQRTTFEYDAAGRLARIVDPMGAATSFAFDASGRVAGITSPNGIEEFRYTAAGRPVFGREPGGADWHAEYLANGEVGSFGDGLGARVQFGYDALGNRTRVVAPDGAVYTSEFDSLGRLVTTADPTGNRSEKQYDREGRSLAVVEPDGSTWRRELDAHGRTTAIVDPTGARTRREYHANGALARIVDPDGAEYAFEVDPCGRVTAIVDPLGGRTVTEYSPAGRVVRHVSPEGRTERYEYDAAGRLAATQHADGTRETVERDARGRIVQTALDDRAQTVRRDAAGRVTEIGESRATVLEWSAGGRLQRASGFGNAAVQFDWDPRGLLASVQDPAGIVTNFERDVRGRVTETRTGDAHDQWTFDSAGRLERTVDAIGRTHALRYDASGHATELLHDDASGIVRGFDAAHRLVAIDDETGAALVRFEYDLVGRTRAAWSAGGIELRIERDAAGLVVATETAGGRVRYERDRDGLAIARHDVDGSTTRCVRDAAGAVIAFEDSEAGRVELPHDEASVVRDGGGRIVSDADGHVYRYDAAGRLAESMDADGRSVRYEYGELGLLEVERRGPGERRYEYDPAGQLRRLTSADGVTTTYGYDAAGRRVRAAATDGAVTDYAWDALGRLRAVRRLTADGRVEVTAVTHDGIGRPVLVGETPIGWDDATTGKVVRIGDRRFVRLGLRVRAAQPDAHWASALPDDPWGDDGGRGIRLGFRGELAVDDLVFMGARVYHPATRSFLSPDPLASVPGASPYAGPYAYAWNDPVNLVDPSGLRPISDAEFDQIRKDAERGNLGKAWDAMVDDPWGTLAMVGVIAVGVGLCFVPGGQAIGAGILIGAAISAGQGVVTGTFNPRSVAIGGALGAIPGGAGLGSKILVGAGTGVLGSVLDQTLVQGKGITELSPTQLAIGGLFGGAGGAAAHGAEKIFSKVHPPTEGGPTGIEPRLPEEPVDLPEPPSVPGTALEPSPWPPNGGAIPGTEQPIYKYPGELIDRYGRPDSGVFASPEGVPYENRSLRPGTTGHTVYQINKPIPVIESRVTPWFGQPGGGIQYELPVDIRILLRRGIISIVKEE